MAVLKDEELAKICLDFTNADMDVRLDLAFSSFGDLLDTIEYWKSRVKLAEQGEEIRQMKRKALIIEH